jgi:hypothetical protein
MSERICMFCKHLEYEDGGYGEYADPASLSCAKGHFASRKGDHFGNQRFVHDVADFRSIIIKAQDCKDYTEVR